MENNELNRVCRGYLEGRYTLHELHTAVLRAMNGGELPEGYQTFQIRMVGPRVRTGEDKELQP